MEAPPAAGAAPVTLHYISEEPDAPAPAQLPAGYSPQVQVFVLDAAAGPPSLPCEECGETLSSPELLAAHRASHRKEPWVECEQCGKSLRGIMGLMGHLRVHRERSFKCTICGARLATPELLREHNRTHSIAAYSFACQDCDLTFQRSSALQNHRLLHHPKPVTSFPCARCSRTFTNNAALSAHQFYHLGPAQKLRMKQRRLVRRVLSLCDQNGQPIQPDTLALPYECDVCRCLFQTESALQAHRRMHERDGRHCCPHCHLRFPWEGSLRQHMLARHPQQRDYRDYKCGECGVTVASRDGLYVHLKDHLQV